MTTTNVQDIDFTKVPNLEFHDSCHTKDESAAIIAQIYCAHILRHASGRGQDPPSTSDRHGER